MYCGCLSGAQAPHDTVLGFLLMQASKPWVCLLHCGDLKKCVLLPQWVPYTQGSVKIHIYVLACPEGLILAMLGLQTELLMGARGEQLSRSPA